MVPLGRSINLCSTAVYRNLDLNLFSSDLSSNWYCTPKRVNSRDLSIHASIGVCNLPVIEQIICHTVNKLQQSTRCEGVILRVKQHIYIAT